MSEEEFGVDWKGGVMRVPDDPVTSGKKDRHQGGEKSRVWHRVIVFTSYSEIPARDVKLIEGKAKP